MLSFVRGGKRASGQAGKKKLFYGWIIVAASFLMISTLGEGVYSFGVFFKPLENEFGWSRATVSSAYTVFLLGFGFSGFYLGRLADTHGPRRVLLLSGAACGAGFVLARWTQEIWQLWIFMGLAGLGAGPSYSVPVATVQRWFVKKRGQALGMVVMGTGVGALVFVLLTNRFIEAWGWRTAYLGMGAIILCMTAIAAPFLVHSPSKMGLRPYGEEEAEREFRGRRAPGGDGVPVSDAVRTQAFIGLCVILMSSQVTAQIVMTHLIPFAIDVGIDSLLAASAIGLIGAFSVPGRLASGFICDRIGWSRAMGILYLAQAAVVLVLFAVQSYGTLLVFVVFYGTFNGARIVTQTGIVGHLFGIRHLGALTGLTMGVSLLTGAAGPYIAGLIYDHTQSYVLAFIMMAFLLGVAGLGAFLLRPPAPAAAGSQN